MSHYILRMMVMLWLVFSFTTSALAKTTQYELIIDRTPVNITETTLQKITINGSIPGPVLRFTEGDDAVITVTNSLDEPTSVHWHGLLVPGSMDGVTDFNGFEAIAPRKSFTYRFPLRQAGTYWYHSHTNGQEQDGHYGSIIVAPKGGDPITSDKDYVVLISDFSQEDSGDILANLKKSSDYYATQRRTVGDFVDDVHNDGWKKAWSDAKMWGDMRMSRTDLADVTGYTFLINGKSPQQNWTGLFKAGERVRLRFINAGTMSMFDVRIPHLSMSVVQADGQPVEPVAVDEFRFAPGETYDVIVIPKEDKAYTIVAEPIDRTSFALGTLAPREGMKGEMPQHRHRAELTMGDMGDMDMSDMEMTAEDMQSGWADTGTPEGDKALNYEDLRYAGIQHDTRTPQRTIDVRLGGNMERYIWTINGTTFDKAEPIRLRYGERVRLTFTNETMMAHPMHLHGMFVQLENGQPAEKMPNKHTVIVPPAGTYSVLLTADEAGEWAFHCHLLYHMASGMMRKVTVAKLDAADIPPEVSSTTTSTIGGHHAH
jgi:FtsP/CotA-like multicopper oxidase with cupredoxin domain